MLYLGLIGYPVKHSVSPEMHNAALKKAGVDAIYLAFEVRPDQLEDAIKGAKALGFLGLNVTLPYKEEILNFVKAVGDASKINAANTLDLRNMLGYNTDVFGVEEAFKNAGVIIEGKKALVVGSGGAGKACAYALLKNGAEVILTNRTVQRGIETAEILRRYGFCIFHHYEKLEELEGKLDIIVNATTLGMVGFENKIPVPESILNDVVVFDTVYNPIETPLISLAKKMGCKVINGVEMLVYQGAKAFEIWTGLKPDVDLMREVAIKSITKSYKTFQNS
ncbi:MAG: shikimate dehydrogenase [Archaeoglobales archaeon]|nr:shikimate dehydrogenase [Archaeoglobales archaeon]